MTYFLSLPLCLEWNNWSYFTPDNGDRRLSRRLHLHLGAVMFTELWPSSWVNVFATVVGHRCLHTASCDPLFQSRHSKMNTISDKTSHWIDFYYFPKFLHLKCSC